MNFHLLIFSNPNIICIFFTFIYGQICSFPGGSEGKESANAGDPVSIPGLGRSPGEGNGNPLQFSWRIPWAEEWWARVHGVTRSRTQLSDNMGFPGSSDNKESTCNAGHLDLNPGLGRSPGEGNGNPLQYSGLENPRDRGVWWTTVY